jgi:uncharacterized membrane-anchored protein
MIAVLAALYFLTRINRALLFWSAFELTWPLNATLGDALTKPKEQGGLELGMLQASVILAVIVIGLVAFTSTRTRTSQVD